MREQYDAISNAKERPMTQEDTHFFRLRIPADIKARAEEAARKNRRSLNGEIIYQLEKVFPDPATGGDKA